MPAVTVYTTGPACHKCTLTKNALRKGGVEFTEVLLADDAEAAERFKEKGYLVAPVVVTGNDEWFDFRIDKIRGLISAA